MSHYALTSPLASMSKQSFAIFPENFLIIINIDRNIRQYLASDNYKMCDVCIHF